MKGLLWVGQQYAVRIDQLQVLLGRWAVRQTETTGVLKKTTAERVISRWRRAGWVEARQIFAREPVWVWLTRIGLQQIGLPYKVWSAKAATLNHLYWCNTARLWVEQRDMEKGRQGQWTSDRELRYQAEQAERQQRAEGREVERGHRSDADVMYGTTRVAIEVEITSKAPGRAAAIMRALLREYQAVWYFVGRDTRELITSLREHVPGEQQRYVSVIDLDQCVHDLAPQQGAATDGGKL
jgi:hypothetical protein